MKKQLLYLFIFFSFFTGFSQVFYPDYVDGKIYLKVSPAIIKTCFSDNPHNIPVSKLEGLEKIFKKYVVTNISRPFYAASDDENLPFILKITISDVTKIDEFIDGISRLKGIVYAEKVPLMRTHATPNDPLYSGAVHLAQIGAPNAWNVFNGNSNITVAIVDNAVMWTHADLIANTYTNAVEAAGTTGVDDDGNGYIDDINGWDAADDDNNPLPPNNNVDHGTHCAGIAGARTDNGIGVASIGWNIKIIPVKGEPSTSGSSTNVTNGFEGIIYAVKAKARIISCSWGNGTATATEQSVTDYAWARGCIIMASAGNNNNSNPNYPGAYPNVYCVASVNPSDVKSGVSSYGGWVDIAAPGDNIVSTVPYTGTPTYQPKTGTSMATPMVAGLAALMLSKSPNMTRADVLNCISNTAVNIYTLAGNAAYTNSLGAGRIDAAAAMSCAATFSALPPVASFYAFPIQTCPNTPVNFYDSSLYAPASWSWIFQGGSPATSTLANPTVSWTTPGTYSVSLTASNASGSNTKTRLAYITVAGPIALPLSEGFQGTQFLPVNWTANNIGNDHIYWTRVTGIGGFGTSTASAKFDNFVYNAPGDRDEMRTPKYNFSNVATARLRFDVAYARYNATFSDSLEVKVSTNCGASWTQIYAKGGSTLATASDQSTLFVPSSTQWRTDSIDVSSLTAGQGNVMFSFINRGHYGQPIYLDNINLFFPTPTINAIYSNSVCAGSPVTFTNTSLSSSGYTWTFQGGPATTTVVSPTVTYSSTGTFTTVIMAVNGTSTASATKTINVFQFPVITVNPASICSGSAATLNASGASAFVWTNGPLSATYTVSPLNTTSYTVTGTNGGVCSSVTTTTVFVTPTPTLTAPDHTICSGSSATLTATGAQSYLWSTGSSNSTIITAPPANTVFIVTGNNGVCGTTKTVVVTVLLTPTVNITSSAAGQVCAGSNVTLTGTGAGSYSWNTGIQASSVVVTPTINTNYTVTGHTGICSANNTIQISVGGTSIPVSVQSNTTSICEGMSATITAIGATSYSWNNGSNSPSIIITPSATTLYSVTGTSGNCSGSASTAINVSPNPLSAITRTHTPCTSCIGAMDATTTSGTGPYNYHLSPASCVLLPCTQLCAGVFTLTTTDAIGCSSAEVFTIQCYTGVEDNPNTQNVMIYPNPATEEINITCNGTFAYILYNHLGQQIKNGANIPEKEIIHISNFAKGIYTLEVHIKDSKTFKKIIIE